MRFIDRQRLLTAYYDYKIERFKKRDGRFTIGLFAFSLIAYGVVVWIYFFIVEKDPLFAFVSPTVFYYLNPVSMWIHAFFIILILYLDVKEKIPPQN